MDVVDRLVIVARKVNSTNRRLVESAARLGLDAVAVSPERVARVVRAGDVVLGRLDVRSTLDGPERGLETLQTLERSGVPVLNRAPALLGTHDKLMTALRLAANALPHPRTAHVGASPDPAFGFPVVVKPRFGSWGRDVTLCRCPVELEQCFRGLRRTAWFRSQGALVQAFVQPQGFDLRILVAAGRIVGAVTRVAAPGEWRTNITLGGTRRPVDPPPQACMIALGAAAALGTDLVGVDLLPDGQGGWIVLELNGAVDFTPKYSLGGECVFERVVAALVCAVRGETESSDRLAPTSSGELLQVATAGAATTAEEGS